MSGGRDARKHAQRRVEPKQKVEPQAHGKVPARSPTLSKAQALACLAAHSRGKLLP